MLNGLNLALGQGPTDFDRRHNLVLSGRIGDVPHTHGMTLSATLRMLSGTAFSLIDTEQRSRSQRRSCPIRYPAGTYSGTGANAITVDNAGGRNGAYGPGYVQLDTRIGWRFRSAAHARSTRTWIMINVANRANFVNPTARSPQHQLPAADDAVRRRPTEAGAGGGQAGVLSCVMAEG